jgi:hypothetical protein
MRYPDAVEVKGLFHSGFSASVPVGPEIVPGTYNVTLTVGQNSVKQPFVVKLDPRLHTTQAELQQRFDLLMRIHKAINSLDTALNQAIDVRDAGAKSGDDGADPAMAALNRDIEDLVDLKIQSGEGALVYPGRLRAWLSGITGQVSMAPVAPTASMVQVAEDYIQQADAGVKRLQAEIASVKTAQH